jgi:hypothetical protein
MVCGGIDAKGKLLSSAEVYDESTNTWTLIPPMPTPRASFPLVSFSDGRLLAAGGFGAGVDAFNPATMIWTQLPNLSEPKQAHEVVVLPGDEPLVFGGQQGLTSLATIERLDTNVTSYNFVPASPSSLLERIRSSVEQQRAAGVSWLGIFDPTLPSAL